MQGKVTLEDHFATEATLGDSQPFGPHVWGELRHRLLDFQEQRLRLMDEWGVEIMIASLNSPSVQAIPDVKRAVEVARQANDVLADEVAKHSDRFVGVAALPMQDPETATWELQRCIRDLGFKGALVNGYAELDGKPVHYDLPQYRPFWRALETLDVPFYKPFLSAQNVKPFRFMPDRHRFVSETDFDNYRSNRRPERGDILMTRVGAGIGEAAVLDSDFEFAFYVSLCLIKVPNRLVSADYLVLWLNSPEGRESSTVRTYGKGASQGNLNLGLIRTFKIPLPPLAEQHRIVAKVDALMALCDRLEASLAAADEIHRRLLDALLAEALAPAERQEREAAE